MYDIAVAYSSSDDYTYGTMLRLLEELKSDVKGKHAPSINKLIDECTSIISSPRIKHELHTLFIAIARLMARLDAHYEPSASHAHHVYKLRMFMAHHVKPHSNNAVVCQLQKIIELDELSMDKKDHDVLVRKLRSFTSSCINRSLH